MVFMLLTTVFFERDTKGLPLKENPRALLGMLKVLVRRARDDLEALFAFPLRVALLLTQDIFRFFLTFSKKEKKTLNAMSDKLKILLVGPEKAGKTTVANFLANEKGKLADGKDMPYRSTCGARILEFEAGGNGRGRDSKMQTSVELWDVSGSQRFESSWPAIMHEADAVVLLYNPDNRPHVNEIGLWFEWFVQKAGLSSSKCLVFAHRMKTAVGCEIQLRVPHILSKAQVVESDWDSDDSIRMAFSRFVANI